MGSRHAVESLHDCACMRAWGSSCCVHFCHGAAPKSAFLSSEMNSSTCVHLHVVVLALLLLRSNLLLVFCSTRLCINALSHWPTTPPSLWMDQCCHSDRYVAMPHVSWPCCHIAVLLLCHQVLVFPPSMALLAGLLISLPH